jgi:hypothetical protein
MLIVIIQLCWRRKKRIQERDWEGLKVVPKEAEKMLGAVRRMVPRDSGEEESERVGGRACCLGWVDRAWGREMEIREQKNITGVQIRRVEIQQRGKMQRIPHIAHIDEDARGAPTRDQDHPVMANAVIATDDPTTTLKAMNQKIENDTAVETGAQNRPTTTTPQSLRQDHQDPTEKEKIQNQIHAPNVHPQTQTQTTLSPPSSAQHHHQPPAPAVAAPE